MLYQGYKGAGDSNGFTFVNVVKLEKHKKVSNLIALV